MTPTRSRSDSGQTDGRRCIQGNHRRLTGCLLKQNIKVVRLLVLQVIDSHLIKLESDHDIHPSISDHLMMIQKHQFLGTTYPKLVIFCALIKSSGSELFLPALYV